jgi:TRAP transporter TAXI family solute receptor
MSHVARSFLLLALFIFTVAVTPSALLAFDEPMLSIKTGNTTGVYYAAGSAVAKMHNRKLKEYNLRVIVEASEGSIANIQEVTDGNAAFGIAQANALYYARQGERFWEGTPNSDLRAVLGLYTEDYTIVAAADAGIETLADLKGKTVNIGELGSTDAMQAAGVFEYAGLDPQNDLNILQRPNYEASEMLPTGEIDAYLYTVGHPNLSLIEASSGERKVLIVSPGREMIDALAKEREYLTATDIPIDYYPDIANRQPIPTLGVKAILFTHAEMDEQIVYNLVKEVYENFDLFKRQHPVLANLTAEDLTTKLILPLHPGAVRYFKEVGLLR